MTQLSLSATYRALVASSLASDVMLGLTDVSHQSKLASFRHLFSQRSVKILVRRFWTTVLLLGVSKCIFQNLQRNLHRDLCATGVVWCCSSISCPSNHSILLLTRSTVVHWLHWDFLFTLSSSHNLKMDH